MTGLGVPGVFKLVMGKWFSRITYTGVLLGVFEQLSTTDSKLAEEVSREINVHTDTLYRLLRALSFIGLVEEDNEHKFLLNEDGTILRKDHPMSLRGFFLFEESTEHLICWKNLPEFVQKGPKSLLLRWNLENQYLNIWMQILCMLHYLEMRWIQFPTKKLRV